MSDQNSPTFLAAISSEPSEMFLLNLMMLDTRFPEILSAAVDIININGTLTSEQLCDKLASGAILNLMGADRKLFYRYKWRFFLLALTQGLNYQDIWNGEPTTEYYFQSEVIGREIKQTVIWPHQFADQLFLNTKIVQVNRGFEIYLT